MWLLEKVPSQKAGFKPDSAAVVFPLNLNLPCRMELRMSVLLDPWDYLRNFRGNGPSGEKELTFFLHMHPFYSHTRGWGEGKGWGPQNDPLERA